MIYPLSYALTLSLLLTSIPAWSNVINNDHIVTYDEATFFSHYELPSDVIDFTKLKDGKTHASALSFPVGPLLTGETWGNSVVVARANAWSNNYFIRTTNGYGGYWEAMAWDGDSVGSAIGNGLPLSIYRNSLNPLADPFAMYVTSDTYSGFMGVLPNSVNDNNFDILMPRNWKVDKIMFGFQPLNRLVRNSPPLAGSGNSGKLRAETAT